MFNGKARSVKLKESRKVSMHHVDLLTLTSKKSIFVLTSGASIILCYNMII